MSQLPTTISRESLAVNLPAAGVIPTKIPVLVKVKLPSEIFKLVGVANYQTAWYLYLVSKDWYSIDANKTNLTNLFSSFCVVEDDLAPRQTAPHRSVAELHTLFKTHVLVLPFTGLKLANFMARRVPSLEYAGIKFTGCDFSKTENTLVLDPGRLKILDICVYGKWYPKLLEALEGYASADMSLRALLRPQERTYHHYTTRYLNKIKESGPNTWYLQGQNQIAELSDNLEQVAALMGGF